MWAKAIDSCVLPHFPPLSKTKHGSLSFHLLLFPPQEGGGTAQTLAKVMENQEA